MTLQTVVCLTQIKQNAIKINSFWGGIHCASRVKSIQFVGAIYCLWSGSLVTRKGLRA